MMNNRDELDKFGDYYLIDKIAVGGMAEIWRAKTIGVEGFERNVAIKCILPSYTQNPEFNSMFIDEARIASTLTHSNIVRITNFGVIDNKYYHEMEFVDGRSLRQIFQKCKEEHVSFPIDSACYIISEVCKGLHYAHTKHDSINNDPLNIIHRDMSPQNIMISFEGEVKIIDWGIAKAKGKIEETRAGVLKGKFGYMSPEQAEGEELDIRTDIFSVGIVLYEAITGERLFIADSEINTLKKIKEGVIPLPSRVNPDVDKNLEAIILKALTRPRIERYQTCYDLYDDLVKYLHKKFPAYNSLKLSKFIKEIFSTEIIADRKRVHGREQSVPSYSPSSHSGRISGDKTRISTSSPGYSDPGADNFSPASKNDGERTVLAESSSAPSPYIGEISDKDDATVTVASVGDTEDQDAVNEIHFTRKKFIRPRALILIALLFFALMYLLLDSNQTRVTTPVKKQDTVLQETVAPTEPTTQATTTTPVPSQEKESEQVEQSQTPQQEIHQEQKQVQVLGTASLSLASTPVRSEVIIDGVSKGMTPVSVNDLNIGKRYELILKADGFKTMTKFFTLRKENNNLVLALNPLEGTGLSYLSLDVEPPVLIYVDGKLVSNYKSLYMYQVEPGVHNIRFVNEKMRIDHTMRVSISKGEKIKKNITLR